LCGKRDREFDGFDTLGLLFVEFAEDIVAFERRNGACAVENEPFWGDDFEG
jgi:hypothetical protein